MYRVAVRGEPPGLGERARDERRLPRLAATLARNFVLSVPVEHEPNARHIFQYSYQEPVTEPVLGFRHRPKPFLDVFAQAVRDREERLEGSPAWPTANEQLDATVRSEPEVISARAKLMRGIGWRAKWFAFEAPAVGWGGSHHFEVLAPEGLQIRSIAMRVVGPRNEGPYARAIAGARTTTDCSSTPAGSRGDRRRKPRSRSSRARRPSCGAPRSRPS